MPDNEQTVREFISAWSRLNVDELVDYFTPDGTYHNIPAKPVSGHENLRRFIAGFTANWQETDWEILNLLARGDLVMVERIDRTRVGDKTVDLPCFGVFEMQDGKIREWRDYFDMGTFMQAIS